MQGLYEAKVLIYIDKKEKQAKICHLGCRKKVHNIAYNQVIKDMYYWVKLVC